MAASNVTIRPLRADERADWEPLWKGYGRDRDTLGHSRTFFTQKTPANAGYLRCCPVLSVTPQDNARRG